MDWAANLAEEGERIDRLRGRLAFSDWIVEFSTPSRLDCPLGPKLELVPAQDGRDNAFRETSEKHVAVVIDPLR